MAAGTKPPGLSHAAVRCTLHCTLYVTSYGTTDRCPLQEDGGSEGDTLAGGGKSSRLDQAVADPNSLCPNVKRRKVRALVTWCHLALPGWLPAFGCTWKETTAQHAGSLHSCAAIGDCQVHDCMHGCSSSRTITYGCVTPHRCASTGRAWRRCG